MKKTIIAAAITAGMAAPIVATAGVTTYAQLYAGIDSVDNGTTSQIQQDDNTGRGRFGFKTSEELGGGMTAFAKLEYQVDINDTIAAGGCEKTNASSTSTSTTTGAETTTTTTDTTVSISSSTICQRTGIVGLKAGWGSLSAGRMPGAYKMAGGVTFDPFVTTALDARNSGMAKGAYAQNGFLSQMVQYKSPKVAGIQVALQNSVISDDNPETFTSTEGAQLMSLTYTGVKGLKVIVATAKQAKAGLTDDKKNTKFGFKYNINKSMSVAFQNESAEAATNPGDYNYFNFGYKMGKHNFTIATGSVTLDDDTKESEYMAFGDTIKLSKQTKLIVGYGSSKAGAAVGSDATTVMTVGLRKDF